jgi:hypothetical protein
VLLETRHVKAALSAMTERQTARMRAEPSAWRREDEPSAGRRGLSLVRNAKIELISGSNPRSSGDVAGALCRAAPRAVSPPARDPRVDLGEVQLDKQPWGVKRVYLLPMIMIRTPIR